MLICENKQAIIIVHTMDKSDNFLVPGTQTNMSADIHICGTCKTQFNDVGIFLSHKKHCSEISLLQQSRKTTSFDIQQDTSACQNIQSLETSGLVRDNVQTLDFVNPETVCRTSDGSREARDHSGLLSQSAMMKSNFDNLRSLYQEQTVDSENQRSRQTLEQQLQRNQQQALSMSQESFRSSQNQSVESCVSQKMDTHLIQKGIQNDNSQNICNDTVQQSETVVVHRNLHPAASEFDQERAGGLNIHREETRFDLSSEENKSERISTGGQMLSEGSQMAEARSSCGQIVILEDGSHFSQVQSANTQNILLRRQDQILTSAGQIILLKDGSTFSQVTSSDGQTLILREGTQVSQTDRGQLANSDMNWHQQQQQQQQTVSQNQTQVSSDNEFNVYSNTEMFSGSETSISFEERNPGGSGSETSSLQTDGNVIFHSQEQLMEQIQMDSISEQRRCVDLLNKNQNSLQHVANDQTYSQSPVKVTLQKAVATESQKRLKIDDLCMASILKQDSAVSYDTATSTAVHDAAASAGIYDISSSSTSTSIHETCTVPSAGVYSGGQGLGLSVPAAAQGLSAPVPGQSITVPSEGQHLLVPGSSDGSISSELSATTFQHTSSIPEIQNVLQAQTTTKRGLENVITIPDPDTPGKKRYKCSVTDCTFTTTYIRDLERHNRVHTGERPFICPLCPKSFSRSDKLNIHLRGHTGSKPFKCSFCNYGAADSSSLKKHIRIHTDERPFRCQICPYASRNSSQLIVHLRTHTGDSPFQCSVCDAKFKINSDLKRHMRIHTGEKPYKCDLCDYRCSVRGNLKCHYRINHSSENQMSCPEPDCSFKTSSRKALWEHKKTHDLLRPIKCDICNYACASNSALKMHMRVHSTDRPYNCTFCNYSSKQSGNVKTHIRKRHPETLQIRSGRNAKRKGKGGHWASPSEEDPGIPKLRQNCRKAYKCNICSASFVREDSLRSHTRQHCREIEQNLESTALAVLEQQSNVVNSRVAMTILPPQSTQMNSVISVTPQISSNIDSLNTKSTNSEPYIFISQQKNGEKTFQFLPKSVSLPTEPLSEQVMFSSSGMGTAIAKETVSTTYCVTPMGSQPAVDRMIQVSTVDSQLSGSSRSLPHATVVASAMPAAVMSHSLASQPQQHSSSEVQQNHPMLTAVMENGVEVAVNIPTNSSQDMTYHTESSAGHAEEPIYIAQSKYQTLLSNQSTHGNPTPFSQPAQNHVPCSSSQTTLKRPVRIIQQAQSEASKLVFTDGNLASDYRVVTDSGIVTHQLVQTSQGFQIIQNIPLHSLRFVGKAAGTQTVEEQVRVAEKVLSPSVMSTLQPEQQLVHQPQLVQVHSGHSGVGHLESVNLQVIKSPSTQTSYPVSIITQEVPDQTNPSQNAPAIAQLQIILPSGSQTPQIVRNSLGGHSQVIMQLEEPLSARPAEESSVSMTSGGMISIPISMAQTLLAQQPSDSGVVAPISVIQDGVQLQEVIVAVDRSSMIGSSVTRGTEECHPEAK